MDLQKSDVENKHVPPTLFFHQKSFNSEKSSTTYKEINTTSLNLQMQQQKELSKGSHFSTTFFSPTTTPSSSYHPELQARKQQESSRCSFLLLILTIRVLRISLVSVTLKSVTRYFTFTLQKWVASYFTATFLSSNSLPLPLRYRYFIATNVWRGLKL